MLVTHYRYLPLLVRGFFYVTLAWWETCVQEESLVSFDTCYEWPCNCSRRKPEYLPSKKMKWMASDLMALRQDRFLAWNSLKQLEINFVWYAKYECHTVARYDWRQEMASTKYGNAIEKFLTCQVLYMLQIVHMAPDVIGKMTSIHKCTCT